MDPHIIRDATQLRQVIGAEIPGLAAKNIDFLDSFAVEFIERSPFLILATSDQAGNLDASPKGDAPGFVEVADDHTLLLPDRPGNKLAYGHLNILETGKAGLIFMIPGTRETLRVNGDAELTADPELLARLAARGKPATLVLRLKVREAFFHCAKAFIRSQLWQPENWAEPMKVSFGEIFAVRGIEIAEQRKAVAEQVDNAVEADYKDNL